jgi:hypothetical protein
VCREFRDETRKEMQFLFEGGCKMLKKVSLVVVTLLVTASLANATMQITGIPTSPIAPSTNVTLGISGDGQDAGNQDFWLLIFGPGSISGGTLQSPWAAPLSFYQDLEQAAASADVAPGDLLAAFEAQDLSYVNLASSTVPTPSLNGLLLSGITFHCEGTGDVTVKLLNNQTSTVVAQAVISQIPEPMTVALLGLGGLLLRRKK